MVAAYFINFTDPESLPFTVNAFTSNGPSSPTSLTLNSSAIVASTSLLIYGKGHPEYGERVQEHLVNIMENFSGASEPQKAISGQTWFDRLTYVRTGGSPATFYRWVDDAANVDEGTWNALTPVGATPTLVDEIFTSTITPVGTIVDGAFWYQPPAGSPTTDQLYIGINTTTSNAVEWRPRVYENLTGSPGIVGAPDPAIYKPQKQLKVYDGLKWKNTSNVFASPIPPQDPADGDLWFNTSGSPQANELLISQGGVWESIGSGGVVAGSPTGVIAGSSQFEVGTYTVNPYAAATVDATDPGAPNETSVLVFVNGVQQAQGVDFTYNYVLDEITFVVGSPTSEPSIGAQIVLMTVGLAGGAGGGSPTTFQNLWETISSDAGSVAANIPTDTFTIAGGMGISTAVVGDVLTITNNAPNWLDMDADAGGPVAANTTTDTFTIAGGTSISTAIAGDTLTITNDAPNVDQNIFESVLSDSGTAVADNTTDTLSIVGGTGISTAVVGDVLTITASGGGGGSPSGFVGVRSSSATGSQTTSGAMTSLTWTGDDYDLPGSPQMFNTGTSSTNFVIPEDGKYVINGSVFFNSPGDSTGTFIILRISAGGTAIMDQVQAYDMSVVGLPSFGMGVQTTAGPIELTAGTVVLLQMASDEGGGGLSLSITDRTSMSIHKVG